MDDHLKVNSKLVSRKIQEDTKDGKRRKNKRIRERITQEGVEFSRRRQNKAIKLRTAFDKSNSE